MMLSIQVASRVIFCCDPKELHRVRQRRRRWTMALVCRTVIYRGITPHIFS
jgi:hypothetical protein